MAHNDTDGSPGGGSAGAIALRAGAGIDKLYREQAAWLERALRRHLPNPDDRADVAQESFCRIAQYGLPDTIDHPRALLLKIAVNIVRANAKLTRTRMAAAQLPLEAADAAATHASWAAGRDDPYTAARLRQTFDELPPRCRQVFLLHRGEGYRHAEIAEKLGISVKAVENHMIKANRIFRAKLGKSDA